ncbi:MAG: c-type cytochrome, partial [Gammaproteobacteria bacterium]|nr:c-type cytochrome [Gammaproteobacteria bacterium]
MSDVVSWIVVIGTLGSLVAFALLLLLNRKSGKPGETTGHSYDGIEEYDNPLPAWWFWAFMLSIVFGALYLVYYPGLGNFEGIGKWTQLGELSEDQKISEEKYAPVFSQYRSQSIKQLSQNEEALKIGRRLFSNNCVMCHGSSATGSSGFPNLTDSEWLWGQEPADIQYSIQNGRNAAMPPWEAVLQDKGVSEVAAYVVSLAG